MDRWIGGWDFDRPARTEGIQSNTHPIEGEAATLGCDEPETVVAKLQLSPLDVTVSNSSSNGSIDSRPNGFLVPSKVGGEGLKGQVFKDRGADKQKKTIAVQA